MTDTPQGQLDGADPQSHAWRQGAELQALSGLHPPTWAPRRHLLLITATALSSFETVLQNSNNVKNVPPFY